jgi:hypothetical protein
MRFRRHHQGLHEHAAIDQAASGKITINSEHEPHRRTEKLICGMALGYPDPNAVVNTLVSSRVAPDGFAVFHD